MKHLGLVLLLATLAVVLAAAAPPGATERLTSPNPGRDMAPVKMMVPLDREYLVLEGFENTFPPDSWTSITSGQAYAWAQTDAEANSGAYSAVVQYGPQGAWQDEWLITPALNTAGLTSLTLAFAEGQVDWAYYGYQHDIMVSTTVPDDPGAFTSLLTMTPANHPFDSDWQQVTLDLSAYINQPTLYIAFRYQGEWADNWYLDDILVYQPYPHDVAAAGVSPASLVCFPDTEITPRFTVKNMGQNAEAFDVSMVISRDGTPFYTESAAVNLPVGGETEVVFPPFATELGEYVLTGTALLAGDQYPANDVAIGMVSCLDQQRVPFGILYTNWGCGPCVSANQALDAWYPLQGNNACLIRVHVYWPSGDDPMYLANIDQNMFLLGMAPTDVTGVPTLYMDNTYDMWDYFQDDWAETVGYGYLMSATTPSPLTIPFIGYNQESGAVELFVDVANALPPGADYRLFVAITEDGIAAQGPNGEPIHSQTFRWLFPGTEGVPFDPSPGQHAHSVPVTLDPGWVFDNLRAVAWVQVMPNGAVLNAATVFLRDGVVSNEDHPAEDQTPRLATRLEGAHPNPFNPQTTITFSLARTQHVRLSVFDLSGRHVAELADGTFVAGEHPVRWDGCDAAGQAMASGTYIVHMMSEDSIQASKMLLVR